jgi:hypothetical protein
MTPVLQGAMPVCGQAVLASILNCSLAEACKLVGHRHGTQTRELIKALRKNGVAVADRLESARFNELPPRAILKATKSAGAKNWHWLLYWDGQIHDPYRKPRGPHCITAFLRLPA